MQKIRTRTVRAFNVAKQNFFESVTQLKGEVSVGPQICDLMTDEAFDSKWNKAEKKLSGFCKITS